MYAAAVRSIPVLLPDTAGALCVTSPSRDLIEAVGTWGTVPVGEQVFSPGECWALRQGRVHQAASSGPTLACAHLREVSSDSCLCVPMVAHGETAGVLVVRLIGERNDPGSEQRVAVAIAQRVAPAIANLRLRESLQAQSIRDPLTGLFNRRYLEETLERELRRAERRGASVGVLMFDLDHFKKFNDTFGHEAGDAVLREFGAFLRTHVRPEDIACRYGGEEFTLILPELGCDDAMRRAEGLREGAKKLTVQYHGRLLGALNISGGVAVFPQHGVTSEGLIRSADLALYRAKSEGRDRVLLAAAI